MKRRNLTRGTKAPVLAVGTALASWLTAWAAPGLATAAQPGDAGRPASQVAAYRVLAEELAAQVEAQGILLAKLAERADAAGVRLSELRVQLRRVEATARAAQAQFAEARSLLVAEAVTAYTDGSGFLPRAGPSQSTSAEVLASYAGAVAGEELAAMESYKRALYREEALAGELRRERQAARAASAQLARDSASASAEQAALRRELSALRGRLALAVAAAERQQQAQQAAEEMAVLASGHDLPAAKATTAPATASPLTAPTGPALTMAAARLGTAATSSSPAPTTATSTTATSTTATSTTATSTRATSTTASTTTTVAPTTSSTPTTEATTTTAVTSASSASSALASTAPTSTAPTSTAPASTSPASTAVASTAPASTAPASTSPAGSSPPSSATAAGPSGPDSTPATQPLATGATGAPAPGWQVAVAFAESQIGKPYKWGGAGPASYDCSGLTMVAWSKAGVLLPHSAQDQYDLTTRVPIADLQPGDLVFFGTPQDVYHVGIYIGSGEMVDAPETGQDVMAQSIFELNLLAGGRVR